jgi:hypothetical protein
MCCMDFWNSLRQGLHVVAFLDYHGGAEGWISVHRNLVHFPFVAPNLAQPSIAQPTQMLEQQHQTKTQETS